MDVLCLLLFLASFDVFQRALPTLFAQVKFPFFSPQIGIYQSPHLLANKTTNV